MKSEFIKMIADIGDSRFDRLVETLETTAPEVSVRLNPKKGRGDTAIARQAESRVEWWREGGVYLSSRPRFTSDPALHQGRYYVQDASSMITAAVAKSVAEIIGEECGAEGEQLPLLWLDACSAPGGKATAALDGLPDGSLVVANEYDYLRAEILKENIAKWGNPSTVVTRGDTAQFGLTPAMFDVVAVDAPCSGEGMMRKDLTVKEQWTPALVDECCSRQWEILENLWGALRPGGFLIYSTCTFNIAENEMTVERLRREFGAESVDLNICDKVDREVEIEGVAPTYAMRFIPGRIRGEGLFMAVLRKSGKLAPAIMSEMPSEKVTKKGIRGKCEKGEKCGGVKDVATREMLTAVANMISPEVRGECAVTSAANGVRIFPRRWSALLPIMLKRWQVIAAGVEAAQVKGNDLIPTQELALSTIMSKDAFPMVALTENEALAYLSRETVTLPAETPRGFVAVTFEGFPLGFVKNIGNRANNLYPKEWRIRNKG